MNDQKEVSKNEKKNHKINAILSFFFLTRLYLAMWQGKEKKVTMHMNEENLFCSFLLA